MGLFQRNEQAKKKSPLQQATEAEERFFDEYFREELRNHGRWYFEKIIKENGTAFRQDLKETVIEINSELKDHIVTQLDVTVAKVNTELKSHVTKQLDKQFLEYGKVLTDAQDAALQSISRSARTLEEQQQQLSKAMQQSMASQETTMSNVFEETMSRVNAMQEAHELALQSLQHSVQALEEQQRQLNEAMQKNIADQEARMIDAFDKNMARIIEHYLLEAMGEQFDMKAQLPLIIQQLEANKKAITDDMKL